MKLRLKEYEIVLYTTEARSKHQRKNTQCKLASRAKLKLNGTTKIQKFLHCMRERRQLTIAKTPAKKRTVTSKTIDKDNQKNLNQLPHIVWRECKSYHISMHCNLVLCYFLSQTVCMYFYLKFQTMFYHTRNTLQCTFTNVFVCG